MNTSLKLLILSVCLLFVMYACQSQDVIEDFEEYHEKSYDIEQIDGIQHRIAVNIMASRYGGYYKGGKSTVL